jgi:hypothetical protein
MVKEWNNIATVLRKEKVIIGIEDRVRNSNSGIYPLWTQILNQRHHKRLRNLCLYPKY